MTSIATIENLMQALDENPELLAALRARILTRELLELPATVARIYELLLQLTEQVNRNSELIAQNAAKTDRNSELIAQNAAKIDRLSELVAQNAAKIDQNAELIAQNGAKTERAIQGLRDDSGFLKAAHARNAAERQASAFTEGLGLRRIRNLTYDDLLEISRNVDPAEISRNDLLSFRNADLVLEAVDAAGDRCYVAVEVSYTANGRDTRRALRNARYLTRFTGLPAHAAVSGVHQDNRIAELITAGAVFWHPLERDDLESD